MKSIKYYELRNTVTEMSAQNNKDRRLASLNNIVFEDDDVQFDNKKRCINVYTWDTTDTRYLLTKDGSDPFVEEYMESYYGEVFYINFYTDYYPETDRVAIEISVVGFGTEEELEEVAACYRKWDNVKQADDRFEVILSEEEEAILKKRVKEYLGEDLIRSFVED